MKSTNVPSKKDNPAAVVGQTIPTDKGLEIPPKTAKRGVSEKEVKKAEQQGEIVISQAASSVLREDGTLKLEDGTIIAMVNPKAYQTLMAAKKQKAAMKENANKRRAQAGMESR